MKSHFDYPEIYNSDGTSTKLGRTLAMIARNDSIEMSRKEVEGLIKLGFITYGLHPRGGYRANITSKGRTALTLADGYKVASSLDDDLQVKIAMLDAAIENLSRNAFGTKYPNVKQTIEGWWKDHILSPDEKSRLSSDTRKAKSEDDAWKILESFAQRRGFKFSRPS